MSNARRWLAVGTSIAAAGLVVWLHVAGRDWDGGHLLHPDERFLAMTVSAQRWPSSVAEYFDEARSPLNPRNAGAGYFAYGTLPTTLLTGLATLAGPGDAIATARLGRALNVGVSLLTVLLTAVLAWRIVPERRVAGLAALLQGCAALPLQHAHFFVVDPLLTFFVTLSLIAVTGRPRAATTVVAGGAFGLALACKVSVVTLIVPIAVAALTVRGHGGPNAARQRPIRAIGLLALAGSAAVIAFRIAQPDAFIGWWLAPRWVHDLSISLRQANGAADVPPGIQWAGRTPYLFAAQNLLVWGLGPALGLAVVIGWLTAWRPAFRGERALLVLLTWTGVGALHLAGGFVMAGRYLLPLYPALVALAARSLVTAWDGAARCDAQRGGRHWRALAGAALALVLGTTVAWAVALTGIHRAPHTRVTASEWLYAHLPAGATIAVEHWDDPLPLRLESSRLPDRYGQVVLALYDEDTPAKLEALLTALNTADYVVLSSQRLRDSIPRLPMRYPMTMRYYEALESGRLGFALEASFDAPPRLGPWTVSDRLAEEAFSVYDHPPVRIYRKQAAWHVDRARRLLGAVDWQSIAVVPAVRARAWGRGAMLSAAEMTARKQGGTWTAQVTPGGVADRWPVAAWALLLALIGIAGFPLVRPALRSLPDEGWLVARTAGLLLLAYAVWMPASQGWLTASRSGVAAVAASLVVLSAWAAWVQREALARWWHVRRTLLFVEEALFWSAFVGFVLIRRLNPDLWHPQFGGEKPMDVAYLLATLRSESFPPLDPWFAGGTLNYYYFGFVVAAMPIKLSGLAPEVAYNLLVPTLFALTVAGAFVAVHPLAVALGHTNRAACGLALLGSFFTAVCGNLLQARLIVEAILAGTFRSMPVAHWFWSATRAIPASPGEPPPITEFPFFTFLYGDLHAHAMALPVTLLVLALALSLVADRGPRWTFTRIAWLALALGALFPMNAWDYPTWAAATGVAVAVAAAVPHARSPFRTRALVAIAGLAAMLAASRLLFEPFYASYVQPFGALVPWTGSRTGLLPYLQVHGLFLALIVSACVVAVRRRPWRDLWPPAALPLVATVGLLAVLGVTLTATVEVVALQGDGGRMNSVFKLYLQAWVLLSIAAAAAVAVLANAWRARRASWSWPARAGVFVWATVCVWLVLAAAAYAPLAVWARASDRMRPTAERTLDGLAFMRTAEYEDSGQRFALEPDLEAIHWLRAHVAGTPVIAEAHRPEYRWGARISVHTGLPTILGWRHHQGQQRTFLPGSTLRQRMDDISTLYASPDRAAAQRIIDRYNVDYVYVGPLERATYPAEGLAKFHASADWPPVYDRNGVTILRVRRTAAP